MADRAGTWITVTAQAEGNQRYGYRITHYWDGRQFRSKAEAVTNGFTKARSDDFNVALAGAPDGGLAELWWMDKRISEKPVTLAEISRKIGLVR